MTGLIWLTNVETAEMIGVPLSKLLLIEQKRPQDGGAVALYLDHGKDFYAGITFANTGDPSRALMMAWVGCHLYSKSTPTAPWRGALERLAAPPLLARGGASPVP